jgi:hypothetical protein
MHAGRIAERRPLMSMIKTATSWPAADSSTSRISLALVTSISVGKLTTPCWPMLRSLQRSTAMATARLVAGAGI